MKKFKEVEYIKEHCGKCEESVEERFDPDERKREEKSRTRRGFRKGTDRATFKGYTGYSKPVLADEENIDEIIAGLAAKAAGAYVAGKIGQGIAHGVSSSVADKAMGAKRFQKDKKKKQQTNELTLMSRNPIANRRAAKGNPAIAKQLEIDKKKEKPKTAVRGKEDRNAKPKTIFKSRNPIANKRAGIDEKLTKSSSMGDYIDDFKKSDAPQFKGKSQEKRREMAIAAKLANEAFFQIEMPDMPLIFVEAGTVGEVKKSMREKLKPKAYKDISIERVTQSQMRQKFRDMSTGKDKEEADEF